ncbi:MAG: H(+)/Cl(-) exchange transporter ClcA [Candidatus Binatia bacterium]
MGVAEPPADQASTEARPQAEALRQVRDFERTHELRRRQLPRSILVGLIVGLVAVAFRQSLLEAEKLRHMLVAFAWEHPWWAPALPVLLGACGAAIAVHLVRRVAPEAAGSGIPHVKGVLHGARSMRKRVLPVKFFGGIAGIGGGLVMGREGPTIQMGAAVGHMVGGWITTTPREKRTLIAAGAGAGLAAAFNAPLAGLVFVLEELQRDFSPGVFTATLIAAAVADVTTRLLLGQLPVFHVVAHSIPPLVVIPAALLLGVIAALAGIAFNRALVRSLDLFARITWKPWAVGAAVGAAVASVGLFAPEVLGGGDRLVERILSGSMTLTALAGLFVIRFVLTMVSYGSGAPGGIFAPLLMLGAALGLAVGQVYAAIFPGVFEQPESFAVVGMAAYFSAVVRAPLTGVVLMVEMTGDYSLVLPLLAASLSAYGVADYLKDRPIYEALLQRDMMRGQEPVPLGGTLLLEMVVSPGSRYDGACAGDLDLPPGCILILRRRGLSEDVPVADTRLNAGDTITVVVAAEAADAVPALRRGAGLL